MKPPKSRKAELSPNATGGEKSHAEAADSAEFKMTELGPIPVDWEVKRLGECGLFSKGAGISRAQANSGRIPAVRYGELYTTHHDYIKAFESFISDAVAKKSTRLTCGDIVFACSGETKEEIGKCAAFLGNEIAYAGGDLIIFSPESEYDSKFLAFELNTPICVSQKAAAGQGDAVVHIRRESLENLRVLLPPLAEQRRIARALSDVDELISALGKLIEKKRNIKTGAMQELLTGKTRLPGFGAEFKMTELGPIPKDWEVKRLGDVAPLQRGFDLPFSHLMEGVVPVVYSNGIGAYHSKGMCKGPGLVTGRSGTIGKFFYIESGDYWPHNTTLWVTDFCGNNPLFVKYLYETLEFEDFSTGTGVPTLNRNSVHEHKVGVPPTLSEQKAIAAALSDMDAEIAALEADRAKYERIKSGMMQELLTGKTRLKGE